MPSGFLYGYVYTQSSVYIHENVEPVLSLVPQCKGLRIVKRTYSEPYPPSWILGELLTIENVNAIYRNIKQNRIRKHIAKRFGLPINVFESWLTVIAVTRNACGHHSRVWNKQNAIQPAIPINPAGEWITLPTDSMRAYFDLCIIKYFLNVISPNNDMQSKLTWLFIRFPEIDLKAFGFPQGWETEPLWR